MDIKREGVAKKEADQAHPLSGSLTAAALGAALALIQA